MKKQVAILGCAFRFPSTTTENYWSDLLANKDLVTEVDGSRWNKAHFLHPDKQQPGTSYTFSAGSIGDVAQFDAGFFSLSPREATLMDPQQRLLLEMSWEAFEHAGIRPSVMRGSRCGVYIGIASADYSYRISDDLASVDASMATGNTASIAANRLSYFYDLRGPSMAIDTACSSAMVAFHQACRAILSGEVTHALTGGVSLHLHPYGFITFSKASMLSPDGRCKVFDASGNGYVRSEGGGVFILKDYDTAVADGDPILAVVAHSAVNTDGRKSGLTIPSANAQAALLTEAYQSANIDVNDIDYIEAHGTGTAVGDPIETRALAEALGQQRRRDNALPIGSIKSNLGHLEAASGIAGLVKAVYSLRHREVPATIGIRQLNPNIPFSDWNLDVVQENRLLAKKGPLTIGVNSFGFGGANAHIILTNHETAQNKAQKPRKISSLPLMLSARSTAALQAHAAQFADFLQTQDAHALYDIVWHNNFRRERFNHHLILQGDSPIALAEQLSAFATKPDTLAHGAQLDKAQGPVFVYSGNGCQWVGMGRQLLGTPVFRQAIEEVDQYFMPLAGYSLLADLNNAEDPTRYQATEIAQPALFALQVGITRVLAHHGVVPQAVLGHSVGEVAAAWASGALSLADAVKVIYHRSQQQGRTRGQGQMTAVKLELGALQALLRELVLSEQVHVAGINSPSGLTLAGDTAALETLEHALKTRHIKHKRLDLDYAFHSPAMDCIAEGTQSALADLSAQTSRIPFISTVSGCVVEGHTLTASYWWDNIRQPVAFQKAIEHCLAEHHNLFVEIGAQAILRGYVQECANAGEHKTRLIPTLNTKEASSQHLQNCAWQVLIAGATPAWTHYFNTPGQWMPLPHYPWQRERYWYEPSTESLGLLQKNPVHPLLGSPLAGHPHIWENFLDPRSQTMLADHVVGNATVFPGTAWAEVALAVAEQIYPQQALDIEALEIHAPLVFEAHARKILRTQFDAKTQQVRLFAREQMLEDAWTLHASARLRPEARALQYTVTKHAEHANQLPDFNSHSHQQKTLAVGLSYGPAFCAVEQGWLQHDTVDAQLNLPASIADELPHYRLHPALLDSSFQLIIHILERYISLDSGLAFVPVRVERLRSWTQGQAITQVRATLRERSPHSILVDFQLFDATGQAIAQVDGARFRSVKLQAHTQRPLQYLAHQLIASPHPLSSTLGISKDTVLPLLRDFLQSAANSAHHTRYANEIEPLLDALCKGWIVEQNGDNPLHEVAYREFLQRHHNPAEVNELRESGINAQNIWISLSHDYPDFFQAIHAVGQQGLLLDQAPQPPSYRRADLNQLVLGADTRQQLAHSYHQIITTALQQRSKGQRIRIIEIAECGPTLASNLCAKLDFTRCDYLFASHSDEALSAAKHLQENYSALSIIDLRDTAAAAAQDMQYDLAFLTLDQDQHPHLIGSLHYLSQHLAPQASLITQGQHPALWLDFVLGNQAPWWLHAQDKMHTCQWSAQALQEQLAELGFEACQRLDLSLASGVGPWLLVAQRKGNAMTRVANGTPQDWLIITDPQHTYSYPLAQRLQAKLSQTGQAAALVSCAVLNSPSKANIIFIPHASDHHEAPDAAAYSADCYTLSRLLAANPGHQSWIITHHALQHLDNAAPANLVPHSHSALWGFVRSMMNEAPQAGLRLIDVADKTPSTTAFDALYQELTAPSAEQELVIAHNGERFAPRLDTQAAPQITRETKTQNVLRLGFSTPGQLRNLRWESHPRPNPANDQLEIAIEATGLNFRDVMYTLGLLSDEAIENGFAGPSLGLEFSGRITRIGSAVTDFQVGDSVLGFGPSSFSNFTLSRANALAKIPDGMSFEAAATIPSTFFTAWYALRHLAQLEAGERVLIHGAAGGVGLAAIQIARYLGAEIFATAGNAEKRQVLQLLGVEHILDSRSLDFADDLMALTHGEGVDVVLNSLAGEAIHRNFSVLRPFGRFLELGKRDFYENTHIGLRPFRNNISYFGIDADQLMSERPALTQRLFREMMGLFHDGTLHALPYTVFAAEHITDAFRHMQQARQIGKIVVTYRNGLREPLVQQTLPAFKTQGSWLITGGLSGFGLRTAEWLAECGAERLVLISRQGHNPQDVAQTTALTALRQRGVTVVTASCDVSDGTAVEKLVAQQQLEQPLCGLVHAAVVIEDGLAQNLNPAQIHRVLAPKILGAWHLHRATEKLSLQHFIVYSSATTLFGNPGQASYVAANHWLEALMHARRHHGLAGTAVLWGAIDDVGFLARNLRIKDALQDRMGGHALQSAAALAALGALLQQNRSGEGVLELDWHALTRFLPSADSPRFTPLRQKAGEQQKDDSNSEDIQGLLQTLAPEALKQRFIHMLKEELGEILRLAPEKIDAERSIYDMGLDSLMGVEFVTALENRFGVRLPVMALSDSATLPKLAERLITQLQSHQAPSSEADTQTLVQNVLVQHAVDAPSADVQAFAEKIAQGKNQQRMIH